MTTQRPNATLSGIVEAIIDSPHAGEPEKAQIAIEGANDLSREIRIENTLKTEDGEDVNLKLGAVVQITVREGRMPVVAKP
jgi:hypothetical protein